MATDWFTPEELSERWKVPVGTLYAWRYKGVGPAATKFGKHLRYQRAGVEEYERSQTAASSSARAS